MDSSSEHDFEEIVAASYGWGEISDLEDQAEMMSAPRTRRRKGPGVLRQTSMFGEPTRPEVEPADTCCQGCGEEIEGEYWATYWGPFHPSCFGEQ